MTLLPKGLEGRLDEILDKYKVIGVALEPWEVPDMGLSAKTAQEELKQALTHLVEAYTKDRVAEIADKIQTLANDFDLPDITTWKQGRFIDKPAYNRNGADWKAEQERREKTLIRPYGGTNNALFQVSGTDRAIDIAAYLEEIANVIEQLKSKKE